MTCTEEVAMRAATARVTNPFYELSIPTQAALPAPAYVEHDDEEDWSDDD